MSTSDELDESILTGLYGAPPDEFVARRKAMAADLRATGNRDGARAVLALRRPSLAEWALNRVAAEDPGAVAEFVTAADAVERAQTEAFRGGDTNVRDAVRRMRDASATVLGRAEQVIDAGGAATASHTAALTSLLAEVAGSEPA